MAATATDFDLELYHRGQSTPPSAQQVRSALRLLRTKRPHAIASGTPSKSKAVPALAWSKPTGGSTSGTPRAAALHCLRTSACSCDRCSADGEDLRLRPMSADKRLPTSVHTEVVGRTLVALSEDELNPIAPAAAGDRMELRTEVRCRLEDQFADLGAGLGADLGDEQFADTVRTPRTPPSLAAAGRAAAGWVTAAPAPAPAPVPAAPLRPPSRPMAWEHCYEDIASPAGDDDEDDEEEEGVESLASLRTQVALAAQRCKEINRLCVTELAQPDGAAEIVRVNLKLAAAGARGAGARGAGATDDDDDYDDDGLELAATVRSLTYPGCGAWAADPSSADAADGAAQLGMTIRRTPGTSLPLPGGAAPPSGAAPAPDEVAAASASWRAGASSSSPPACGQWLAERILASTSHLHDLQHGDGKGSISGGASLHQARHQSGRQRGSLHLHSPETLGPFGPAPSTPQREPPPPPLAGTNPFEEPTNPFSPPGGGLLLSRYSPPRPSSRVLACFGELGSQGAAAPARDGATTPPPPEQHNGGHSCNPFSPTAPLDAPARNPFSPGAGTRFHHAASAADAAGAAFATFAARAAYASTTDAYTSDDEDHVARANHARAERQRLVSVSLSPRRTQADSAAAKELPPLPAEKLPPRTPDEEAAAGAAADAIAARDAAPQAAPGATVLTKPAATPPATPAKQAAVDAAKRSAERRAAAARHRDEVRKYLVVERAASTAVTATSVTASFDSRQRRDALLGLTVRA